MKKLLILLSAFLLTNFVLASAKIVVPIDKEIRISANASFERSEYSWSLVSQDNGEILDTQNNSAYTQKFSKLGKYYLNLSIKNLANDEMQNTQTEIIVGKSYKYFDKVNIELETVPPLNKNGEIEIVGSGGKVIISLSKSEGVKEYQIDQDISEDSDGNGKPDDDIDNKKHNSLKDGSNFEINYLSKENLTAKIKLIGYNDIIEERKIQINFKNKIVEDQKETMPEENIKAIIDSLPKYDVIQKEIYVPFGINEVIIYSKNSIGKSLEYRIDEDVNEDSNGDGNPGNDINNEEHPSLRNGEVYAIKRGNKDSQIVQLIVLSGKKGSGIKRKIVWGKENKNKIIEIFSSTDEALVGSEIVFGISGIEDTKGYNIEWDLDGDSKIDEKNKTIVKKTYEKKGLYKVKTKIVNDKGEIIKNSEINVRVENKVENEIKTKKPIADFDFIINGPVVTFTQKSWIDPNLIDKKYSSFWKFGNGNISNIKDPEFIYSRTGDFDVELMITDSQGKISKMKKEISVNKLSIENKNFGKGNEIDQIPKKGENKIPENTEEKKSIIQKIDLKKYVPKFSSTGILNYIGIFILGFLGLIILYLLYQKIKHPDYSFGEIIEEEKEKIISIIEGETYVAPEAHEIKSEIQQGVDKILDKKEEEKNKKIEEKIENKEENKLEETKTKIEHIESEVIEENTNIQEENNESSNNENTSMQENKNETDEESFDNGDNNIGENNTGENNTGENIDDNVDNKYLGNTPPPPPPPPPPIGDNKNEKNNVSDKDIPDWLK